MPQETFVSSSNNSIGLMPYRRIHQLFICINPTSKLFPASQAQAITSSASFLVPGRKSFPATLMTRGFNPDSCRAMALVSAGSIPQRKLWVTMESLWAWATPREEMAKAQSSTNLSISSSFLQR